MTPNNFCIFILTHGRPNNLITIKTLNKAGYTGRLYFIVDNEDDTAGRYIEKYGAEKVIMFNKLAEADECDEGNNFDERRTITMARNACFKIARDLGVTHFLQLDDDFDNFWYEIADAHKRSIPVKNIDLLFCKMLEFYKSITAHAIAFAQSGDFIGGLNNVQGAYRFNRRKCMNSFFCSTERPFKFVGAMNEDVNTYTTLGSRGALFLTVPFISVNQARTQERAGGITDMYKRFGTYCKGFTTVMMMPSSVCVSMMDSRHPRIHHRINWPRTVPCILSERYKKKQAENG